MLICIPAERADEEADILSAHRPRGAASSNSIPSARERTDTLSRFRSSISPIKDRDGRIIGASKIARDNAERKQSESKLQLQLARLDLLNRIARATAERQDIRSIFQVVVRSLEDNLQVDFCCACLHNGRSEIPSLSSMWASAAKRWRGRASLGGKSIHSHRPEWAVAMHIRTARLRA